MPYLKCTEELCPLGFQTHISSGAWGSQRLLSCINTVYICAFISSDPKLTTETAVLNKCVVCVWFGGFLIQDFGHAFFCAMCTYSLNETVFFNFDEQVVDKSIYCRVEEYCAVFWSAAPVSVHFSCLCECALRVCITILRDSDILWVCWPQSHYSIMSSNRFWEKYLSNIV